ncbi:hypothetical protein [Verrucomicrobium spinosum]|uniref:hypothetical protein n=1 Tax=Verrucomicrobium spinosum TaxID=2736 RepID=UPI000946413C|nr:hypothetical protein [Verrucomicrobium spinosum]
MYSPSNDTEGDLTGHFIFSGKLGDWRTLKGRGALIILNGNLYAVPILGPLTPLIGALLPRPMSGYNLAKEADCTFQVADGFVRTDDLEALTGVFRLVSKGQVDFLEDRIKFEAQVKFRGLPGWCFSQSARFLSTWEKAAWGSPCGVRDTSAPPRRRRNFANPVKPRMWKLLPDRCPGPSPSDRLPGVVAPPAALLARPLIWPTAR